MWFVLGIVVGVLITLGTLFGLVMWMEHTNDDQLVDRWLDKYLPKEERKVAEGHIGTFVLNEDGEIERMGDCD